MIVLLVVLLLLSTLSVAASVTPITTEMELRNIGACLNCSYVLLANITLTSPWTTVGDTAAPFTGNFDGQGHTITFPGFVETSTNSVGFFGVLEDATILELKLLCTELSTNALRSTVLLFGLLAGTARNVATLGCSAILQDARWGSRKSTTAGGLFGAVYDSRIELSYSILSLVAESMESLVIGGIAGNATAVKIYECETMVTVTMNDIAQPCVGGVVGTADAVSLIMSFTSCSLVAAHSSNERLGGFFGSVLLSRTESSIWNSLANVTVNTGLANGSLIGGAIGSSFSAIVVSNSSVILNVSVLNSSLAVGGVVGYTQGSSCNVKDLRAGTTLSVLALDTETSAYSGGLIGHATAKTTRVETSVAMIDFSVLAGTIVTGGLLGAGIDLVVTQTSAMGRINVTAHAYSEIGGIIGKTSHFTIRECSFIGEVAIDGKRNLSVGGLVAHFADGTLESSYVLASINAASAGLTVGGISGMTNGVIRNCYGIVQINVSSIESAQVGGALGQLNVSFEVCNTFVVGTLVTSGKAGNQIVGGFVGAAHGRTSFDVVKECYNWAVITTENSTLGGFVGELTTAVISRCAAYAKISSADGAIVGLLAGSMRTLDLKDFGGVELTVVYTEVQGGVANISLIGYNSGLYVNKSYCAAFPRTEGCTPLSTLHTEKFIETFDPSCFQLNSSFANGSITLLALPLPTNGSTIKKPRLVMPNTMRARAWTSRYWVVSEKMLGGFPFLKALGYSYYCGRFNGCHGHGISPLDAVCTPGWSSPPRNHSMIAGGFGRCSIFSCRSNADCSNSGTCSAGACSCNAGYVGLDCSVSQCYEIDGNGCGVGKCMPFSNVSVTGTCQCQPWEYLSKDGYCRQGCNHIGMGVCHDSYDYACLPGYSANSGCFKYNCSAAGSRACNGLGQCTNSSCACNPGSVLLGGSCYTPCMDGHEAGCISVACGENNACRGRGLCMPSLTEDRALCICNVDSYGRPTDTHYGGPTCEDCEFGYVRYEGRCVKNRCQKCVGGTCDFNYALQALTCECSEQDTLEDGVCLNNTCGGCIGNACLPLPSGPQPNDRFCICMQIPSYGRCFEYDCGRCAGGQCTPNATDMQIRCVCPEGATLNAMTGDCERPDPPSDLRVGFKIGLPVAIVGGVVILATILTVVFVRRRMLRMRHMKVVNNTASTNAENSVA